MKPSNQTKKIIYGLIIVLIFGSMYPYTRWLDQEKRDRDLGEAAIGQIDTGSFMMKLFLLGGFRGIVANYLWIQAEDHKRNHDWDRLKTTVDLITKLQEDIQKEPIKQKQEDMAKVLVAKQREFEDKERQVRQQLSVVCNRVSRVNRVRVCAVAFAERLSHHELSPALVALLLVFEMPFIQFQIAERLVRLAWRRRWRLLG